MISVDAYLFLSDSKETELGSIDQEASLLAGKNTGVVLVRCSRPTVISLTAISPYSYFTGDVDISEFPGCC